MKRKILPIVLASLTLGLVFDYLFYGANLIGISFFLFTALALGATLYLHTYFRKFISKYILILAAPILLFAAMTFVRANGFLTFLNIIMVMYLFAMLIQLAFRPHSRLEKYEIQDYVRHILSLPFAIAREVIAFVPLLLSYRRDTEQHRHTVTPVVRGLLLSLPFLFIFLLLFSSADLVFNRYIGLLLDFHISSKLINHTLLIGFITSLFIGVYSLIFTHTPAEEVQVESTRHKKVLLGTIEFSIILGSISFLFAIFVLIQITYLFGGQQNIATAGFTYAEYARKGFFELIAVALLSFALIMGLNNSTLRRTLKEKVLFMWLSSLLIVQVMVIMLSAHKRLTLYEQAYGFTSLRLYSHVFIGWLAVLFVLLLVHIIREEREYQLAFRVFLSVIAGLIFLNFLNPDAFIARKNIQRFNETGKIDIPYLRNLSEDAAPAISTLLGNTNERLSSAVAHELYVKRAIFERQPDDWRSFNIARQRSQTILEKNAQRLEASKNYQLHPLDFNGE